MKDDGRRCSWQHGGLVGLVLPDELARAFGGLGIPPLGRLDPHRLFHGRCTLVLLQDPLGNETLGVNGLTGDTEDASNTTGDPKRR